MLLTLGRCFQSWHTLIFERFSVDSGGNITPGYIALDL